GGVPDRSEVLQQGRQAALRERSVLHVVVLLEAGQGSLVVAGNTQRPVAENAFGVHDVPERFLHTPLPRSIAEISIRLPGRKQGQRIRQLPFQRDENVALGDQRNVFAVIRSVLARLRPTRNRHFGFHEELSDELLLSGYLRNHDGPSRPAQNGAWPAELSN